MTAAPHSALAYDDRGTGVPLVFIHGLTFSRRTWDPVLGLLANGHRCLAIDLPGHGESDGLPSSMEDVVSQLNQTVTDVGIERPIVIGHSLGAVLATIYAATFPVHGVVNVDQPLDTRPFLGMLRQMEGGLRGPDFAAVFEPIRQSVGVDLLPEPIRSATLSTQTIRQEVVLAYWHEPLTRPPEELKALTDLATARIHVPYLAIFGHSLPEAERADLSLGLPQIQTEEWPNSGHMVHLMDPERFATRVAAFVASLAG
jgi:pimeloyl-ACP methyl ester carboxylesterase